MKTIKSLQFKGFDLKLPFITIKFEESMNITRAAGESGKANN